MAFKKLGAVDAPAGVNTTLYTVPTAKTARVTISICNRTGSAINVDLAITDPSAAIALKDYIKFNAPIQGNATELWNDILIQAGVSIIIKSSAAGASFVAWGDEV